VAADGLALPPIAGYPRMHTIYPATEVRLSEFASSQCPTSDPAGTVRFQIYDDAPDKGGGSRRIKERGSATRLWPCDGLPSHFLAPAFPTIGRASGGRPNGFLHEPPLTGTQGSQHSGDARIIPSVGPRCVSQLGCRPQYYGSRRQRCRETQFLESVEQGRTRARRVPFANCSSLRSNVSTP
jgi:hypothetical protein